MTDSIIHLVILVFLYGVLSVCQAVEKQLIGEVPLGFFFFFFNLFFFVYLWLCWVFVSVWGLSLVVASGGHSSSRCAGLSLLWPLLLRSTGSRRAGSVIVAHGPSRSAASGIFPDQGSNPCVLHWQADSQPLRHQGSPPNGVLSSYLIVCADNPEANQETGMEYWVILTNLLIYARW